MQYILVRITIVNAQSDLLRCVDFIAVKCEYLFY